MPKMNSWKNKIKNKKLIAPAWYGLLPPSGHMNLHQHNINKKAKNCNKTKNMERFASATQEAPRRGLRMRRALQQLVPNFSSTGRAQAVLTFPQAPHGAHRAIILYKPAMRCKKVDLCARVNWGRKGLQR